jgi:small subunit ribosomal protein S20
MPNTKSAIKSMKTDEVRRLRTKATRSAMRTTARNLEEVTASGDIAAATEQLKGYFSSLDKAVKNSALKKNTAARYKSNAAKKVAAL